MSRFRLLLSESLRSMGANLSTTVAATMTVLIGMFLLGLFVALGSWVVSWSDHVKNQLEVRVLLTDNSAPKQVNVLRAYLDGDTRIKHYTFVSKADALRIQTKRTPQFAKGLPFNPLPASYNLTPRRAEDVLAIAAGVRAQKFNVVDEVVDGQKTSKRILQVSRAIEVVFLVAVLILLVASVLLISNTIRLSIFSRRREIEVMKLVGATNWFVRGPFMLEGLLCGVVGAVAAIVLLLLGKIFVLHAVLGNTYRSSDVRALSFSLMALILLLVGLGIGALGSGLTLRKFLKV